MVDIAPGLLEQIQTDFASRVAGDSKIQALYRNITEGAATYADAEEYAFQVGQALSQALGKFLTPDVLPDGRLYYNIADRVLRPMLQEDHNLVSDAAAAVQKALNEKAGIGIKPQTVPINTDRVDGIIDIASNAEKFEDVAHGLDAQIKNFSMNVVDETLRANVEFQGKSGMSPKVIRRATSKCCDWCSRLAGKYEYPDVPKDVYRRHNNCRCVVEYDPGKGKRQNVHTKKWTEPGERDRIEERKHFNLGNMNAFRPNDYGNAISRYVSVDREAVIKAARAGKAHGHGGVYYDAERKTVKQLKKSIMSRYEQVERHADKIANPESYVQDWSERNPQYREGLIRKWEKDMRRNAEQAEIELAVFKERFGV